jgi:hypothetical protein
MLKVSDASDSFGIDLMLVKYPPVMNTERINLLIDKGMKFLVLKGTDFLGR